MPLTHVLVTDASPREVEEKTGLRAHPTPLGTLVEIPKRVDVDALLRRFERATNPYACTCGRWAAIHHPNCPAWGVMT